MSFSANVAHRLYPQWAVRVLNLPALAKGEIYQTNDPLSVTVRPLDSYASRCECLSACISGELESGELIQAWSALIKANSGAVETFLLKIIQN